jgi:predicted DNA-binding transcriptional regulator AlpA
MQKLMTEPITKLPPTVTSVEKPKYLFIKECADILRISYKGMWSLIASGEGPPHMKIRQNVRIPQDGFNDWLNSRTK